MYPYCVLWWTSQKEWDILLSMKTPAHITRVSKCFQKVVSWESALLLMCQCSESSINNSMWLWSKKSLQKIQEFQEIEGTKGAISRKHLLLPSDLRPTGPLSLDGELHQEHPNEQGCHSNQGGNKHLKDSVKLSNIIHWRDLLCKNANTLLLG